MTLEPEKVERFIESVKRAFEVHNASDDLKREIDAVIREIDSHELKINNPVPTILPVCKYLQDAWAQATQESIEPIIDSIKHLTPNLVWHQGYAESEMSMDFSDNFGIADVIGPYGLVFSTSFKLGMVLLGPETWYPPHAHPSTEIYYILWGEAEWYAGEDSSVKNAGSMIFHHSNEPHAMLTRKNPLLAIYTWRGNIQTNSKFL
ncbi:MAG: dimethylsulfonioproprionate lyase family protein [Archaeoglobaceae archaeon]